MEIRKIELSAGKPSADGKNEGGTLTYTCGKCGEEFTITKGGIVAPLGTLYCPCGEKWPEKEEDYTITKED